MIKKLGVIAVLWLTIVSLAFASGEVEELMNKANNLYQQEKYEEAIKLYNQIIDNDYVGPELYYNLGNAYFRLGKLGYAILYFEKALKLAPDDSDIQYNLKIANARTVDRIQEVPQLFFIEWWNVLVASLSTTNWATIVLIFYLLFLFSIGLFFLSKKAQIQKQAFLLGSFSLAVLILTAIMLFARINRETSSQYGVLTEQVQAVKVSPDENSNDAFVIHEGIKFKIEDELKDWAKIKLSDGKVGWLKKDAFGKI